MFVCVCARACVCVCVCVCELENISAFRLRKFAAYREVPAVRSYDEWIMNRSKLSSRSDILKGG